MMIVRFSVSKFLLMLTGLALLSLPATAQPETSQLRISAVPIAGFTPIYAADKLGFFKQEGLEVTIDRAAGGAQTVPLLVQGTLQLAVTPVVSAALANQQGFNLRLIPPSLDEKTSSPGQTAQIVLAESAIKSPADLKGKRVAVNTRACGTCPAALAAWIPGGWHLTSATPAGTWRVFSSLDNREDPKMMCR